MIFLKVMQQQIFSIILQSTQNHQTNKLQISKPQMLFEYVLQFTFYFIFWQPCAMKYLGSYQKQSGFFPYPWSWWWTLVKISECSVQISQVIIWKEPGRKKWLTDMKWTSLNHNINQSPSDTLYDRMALKMINFKTPKEPKQASHEYDNLGSIVSAPSHVISPETGSTPCQPGQGYMSSNLQAHNNRHAPSLHV